MAMAARADDRWSGHVDTRENAATKPIDFSYLRRFTLGNSELEREVLYLFAESAPGYLNALQVAASPKEWHNAAHTLKGSARAVGAWRVARTAEIAEKLPFDADADRRAFVLDNAYEAGAEAVGYILQIFPR